MKNKMINDWEPEVLSLLKTLQTAGFVLESSDNGEDRYEHPDGAPLGKLIEELTACDEARLYVTHPEAPGKTLWFYLVLGNSPGELVADYSCPAGPLEAILEKVTSGHYESWNRREQPQKAEKVRTPKPKSKDEPRSISDILDKLEKAQNALDALDNRDENWTHRIGVLRDQLNDMAEEIKDRSSELLNPDFTAAEQLKRQAWERMVEAAKPKKGEKALLQARTEIRGRMGN